LPVFFEVGGGGSTPVTEHEKPKMNFQLKKGQDSPIDMGSAFSVVYVLLNPGDTTWPDNCSLDFIGGEMYHGPISIPIPSLQPRQDIEFSIHLQAPFKSGMHAGSWMMCVKGEFSFMFGDPIWVILNVNENSGTNNFSSSFNVPSNSFSNSFNVPSNNLVNVDNLDNLEDYSYLDDEDYFGTKNDVYSSYLSGTTSQGKGSVPLNPFENYGDQYSNLFGGNNSSFNPSNSFNTGYNNNGFNNSNSFNSGYNNSSAGSSGYQFGRIISDTNDMDMNNGNKN